MDDLRTILRASEAFCRELDRSGAAAAGEATPVQLDCLRFVVTHHESRVKDLARGLGVSHPAATKLVDRLVLRRLLERKSGLADRREVGLELTPAGAGALETSRRSREGSLAAVLDRMDPPGRAALQRGLESFLRAALRTPGDVEAVCGHCGTEHAADCPLGLIYRELTGRLTPPV